MVVSIPLGGTIRSRVYYEITGETSKTYYITVMYGTLNAAGDLVKAFSKNVTVTGALLTNYVDLDTIIFGGLPGQMLDAVIVISDGVDASGNPTPTIYDEWVEDNPIRLYSPYGAQITNVVFSSV